MNEYYFTFMQKQAFKDQFVKIIADNPSIARTAMNDHFGDKWAFMYDDFNEIKEYHPDEAPMVTIDVQTYDGEHFLYSLN